MQAGLNVGGSWTPEEDEDEGDDDGDDDDDRAVQRFEVG
jgi:hypothetical protein